MGFARCILKQRKSNWTPSCNRTLQSVTNPRQADPAQLTMLTARWCPHPPPLPPWYYKRLLLVFVFINKRAPLQFIYNHRWTLNSILYKHLKKYWEWSMVGNIAHVASSHACTKGGEWVVSAYLQSREPPVQKRYSSWLQKGNVHKIKFFMLFYFPVLYSQSRSRFICMARCRALRYIKKEIPAPRGKSVFQKGFFLVLHKAIYVH